MDLVDVDEIEDLGDVFGPEEEPVTKPPTFATYERSAKDGQLKEESVSIRLVGSHPLWGHYLWNAARSFADYLDHNSEIYCKNKRVLELGAGGALPSIICALNGAETVVVTDYPDNDLVENMRYNVEQNLSSEILLRTRVEGHVWGKDVKDLLQENSPTKETKFDVVLLSDLIFNHSQHEALLRSCESCLASRQVGSTEPTPCLLVFYTHHRPHLVKQDMAFFGMAEERGWETVKIMEKTMEAMFKDDPGDEHVRAIVHGWRLWRRPTP